MQEQNQSIAGQAGAVLTTAGFAPWDRAALRITGPDATRWLNGMVTNSIQAMQPGEGTYNFILNAQGRIQGDCMIYHEPDATTPAYLLVTGADQLPVLQAHLDRFIIMDDVELQPIKGQGSLLLLGSGVAGTLANLGLPQPAPFHLVQAKVPEGQLSVMAKDAQTELLGSHGVLEILQERIQAAGVIAMTPETVEQLRVLAATPRYGVDIRDRELPQETGQAGALYFAKGCYVGQEIVERIRSRGQVHRLFTAFRLRGAMPSLPVALQVEGKSAGELTSAVVIPTQDGDALLGIGYARREFLETGATFEYAEGVAHRRQAGTPGAP